ncbi:hypothetical protein OTU49_006321, partial [Cherax quadricarinatus]
ILNIFFEKTIMKTKKPNFFQVPDPEEEGVPILTKKELQALRNGKMRKKLDKNVFLYSEPDSKIVIKKAETSEIIREGVILTRLGDMEGKVPLVGISKDK